MLTVKSSYVQTVCIFARTLEMYLIFMPEKMITAILKLKPISLLKRTERKVSRQT